VQDRPVFFQEMIASVCDLRSKTARPHWLLIDEAHHMLPVGKGPASDTLPSDLAAVIYVTVHPDQMSPAALQSVQTVLAVGPQAGEVLASFARAVGVDVPATPDGPQQEAVLYWNRSSGAPPRWVQADRPVQERKRHTRKYAEGELGEDKSFYFRGAEGALNLRAQNLMIFLQMADGVDDATWLHHLQRGDYARWFRTAIKDDELADEAEALQDGADAKATRSAMRELIERSYTGPA